MNIEEASIIVNNVLTCKTDTITFGDLESCYNESTTRYNLLVHNKKKPIEETLPLIIRSYQTELDDPLHLSRLLNTHLSFFWSWILLLLLSDEKSEIAENDIRKYCKQEQFVLFKEIVALNQLRRTYYQKKRTLEEAWINIKKRIPDSEKITNDDIKNLNPLVDNLNETKDNLPSVIDAKIELQEKLLVEFNERYQLLIFFKSIIEQLQKVKKEINRNAKTFQESTDNEIHKVTTINTFTQLNKTQHISANVNKIKCMFQPQRIKTYFYTLLENPEATFEEVNEEKIYDDQTTKKCIDQLYPLYFQQVIEKHLINIDTKHQEYKDAIKARDSLLNKLKNAITTIKNTVNKPLYDNLGGFWGFRYKTPTGIKQLRNLLQKNLEQPGLDLIELVDEIKHLLLKRMRKNSTVYLKPLFRDPATQWYYTTAISTLEKLQGNFDENKNESISNQLRP